MGNSFKEPDLWIQIRDAFTMARNLGLGMKAEVDEQWPRTECDFDCFNRHFKSQFDALRNWVAPIFEVVAVPPDWMEPLLDSLENLRRNIEAIDEGRGPGFNRNYLPFHRELVRMGDNDDIYQVKLRDALRLRDKLRYNPSLPPIGQVARPPASLDAIANQLAQWYASVEIEAAKAIQMPGCEVDVPRINKAKAVVNWLRSGILNIHATVRNLCDGQPIVANEGQSAEERVARRLSGNYKSLWVAVMLANDIDNLTWDLLNARNDSPVVFPGLPPRPSFAVAFTELAKQHQRILSKYSTTKHVSPMLTSGCVTGEDPNRDTWYLSCCDETELLFEVEKLPIIRDTICQLISVATTPNDTTHGAEVHDECDAPNPDSQKPKRFRNAAATFEYACDERQRELTYLEAWKYLKEHGCPVGYTLPSEFETWKNYASKGGAKAKGDES